MLKRKRFDEGGKAEKPDPTVKPIPPKPSPEEEAKRRAATQAAQEDFLKRASPLGRKSSSTVKAGFKKGGVI